MKGKILIIDDEKNILSVLSDILEEDGHSVKTVNNGESGIKILREEEIDLTLLDIKLPDWNGIDLLKLIKSESPKTEVIMISGYGTVSIAVEATKLGAYDFIEKPLSIEKVRISIAHALEKLKFESEKSEWSKLGIGEYEILGESNVIKNIKKAILRCGPIESKVLISGETGTGKELVATAIHHQSKRRDNPFIKVNCAAIPESLIESELFGHERGAFTGAMKKKIGKFELADNGTIFLDEIGDMELSCQSKVLRVLETGEFERVGGLSPIKVDVRVVAATNKDLLKEIEDGKFREDLYYRLNVVPIHIPPLRERQIDIPILIRHFMNKFCKERGLSTRVLDDKAIEVLSRYDYPGNIRELRNLVERIAIMAPQEIIKQEDIIPILGLAGATSRLQPTKSDIFSDSLTLSDAQRKLSKKYIETQLELHNYNISETAKALGIKRTNLYRKMRELGIKK